MDVYENVLVKRIFNISAMHEYKALWEGKEESVASDAT